MLANGQGLTDIDGSVPVGANAQVGAGTSGHKHVVVYGAETSLGVQEDSLGALVDNIQRLGLSYGRECCESEGGEKRHVCYLRVEVIC